MALNQECPHLTCWQKLLAGEMSVADQAELEIHLNSCPRCVEFLDTLAEGPDGPPLQLQKLREPPPPVEAALERVIEDASRKR